MNELMNITGQGPATMTSLEISALVEKRHDNVMRDTKTMLDALELDVLSFEDIYRDERNREQKLYRLPRDLTMTLVTGYSIPLRKRVIDRLDELERRPTFLEDPAWLRMAVLTYTEKTIELQAALDHVQPLADSYERLTRSDGTFCITDAAKVFEMRPKDFFAWLQSNQWIYRRAGNGHFVGYQPKIQQGLLDHRLEEVTRADGSTKITEQVRITAKGMAKLGELLARKQAA